MRASTLLARVCVVLLAYLLLLASPADAFPVPSSVTIGIILPLSGSQARGGLRVKVRKETQGRTHTRTYKRDERSESRRRPGEGNEEECR